MVRRSSSAFFSHWSLSASGDSQPPSLPVTPTSPNFVDPFGASINLPEPIRRTSTSPFTPQILIASPSTSTIHYLFPSSETRTGTHLTVGGVQDKLSRSGSTSSTGSTESTAATKLRQRSKVKAEGFHLPTLSENMRTLRRQPSFADLGRSRSLKMNTAATAAAASVLESEKPKLSPEIISAPIPLIDNPRRRSQSLSSPRPAPSPPPISPTIPAPDFGAPLSQIVQSPSYTHIDYAPAPTNSSSSSSSSRRHSRGWSIHQRAVYPTSAPMMREAKVRDHYHRFEAQSTPDGYTYNKDRDKERKRRSQSLSSTGLSPPSQWNVADPLPWCHELSDLARKRRESSVHSSPTWNDCPSPYPSSLASGRLHPVFNNSNVSLLAPTSTVGLGFSPISSPESLNPSLRAEAIDLNPCSPRIILSAAPDIYTPPAELRPGALSPPVEIKSRRSLIQENTYYLPGHPRPVRTVRSSDTLPRSSSLSPRTPETPGPPKTPDTPNSSLPTRSFSMRFKFPSPKDRIEYHNHTAHSRHLPLCSPPDAIAMDPITTPLPLSPQAPRRSIVISSTSLRGIGKSISRSLSQVFDTRDHAKLEAIRLKEEEIKSRISSPLEAGRDLVRDRQRQREVRENLLSQAVSMSIGSKLSEYTQNSAESTKTRPGIPQVLLESAPIVENPKYTTLRGLRRSIRRSHQEHLEEVKGGSVKSGSVTYNEPNSIDSETLQISRWSPSPPKRKHRLLGRAGSPPPSSFKERSTSDPIPRPDPPPPVPQRSLSRGRLFFKQHNSSPPLNPSGISSTDMLITSPQPLLQKLSNLPLSQTTPEDKHNSLQAWRDDVRENGEILRLEGQILKHVEKEKEKMREISGVRSRYGGMI